MSTTSIAYNIAQSKDFEKLCLYYCNLLQTIVNQIYSKYKIIIDCKKFKDAVVSKKDIKEDDDFRLLETYLVNDESVNNYRNALLKETLSYYNCENLNEYISHLYERKCCTSEEKNLAHSPPPSSKHYLIFPIKNNSSFPFDNMYYTDGWGPFYWNIFHSVGEGYSRNENLLKFIYVFPMTIPCNVCRNNYINKIQTFENFDKSNIQNLYQNIHDEVNHEKIRVID